MTAFPMRMFRSLPACPENARSNPVCTFACATRKFCDGTEAIDDFCSRDCEGYSSSAFQKCIFYSLPKLSRSKHCAKELAK